MPTLFARLLGDRFDQLPPRVRALHARETTHTYAGRADVERGSSLMSRWMGAATRLPVDKTDQELHVTIEPTANGERWTRRFADHAMPSQLWDAGGLLREKLGLATFGFRLDVRDGELTWRVESVRALGIPLPARMFRGVAAHEFERDGRYHFDVRAELSFVGLLVHYRGWLDVE
jgi:Domain of unknown function (DUF4166)